MGSDASSYLIHRSAWKVNSQKFGCNIVMRKNDRGESGSDPGESGCGRAACEGG
jgi:hypothetical protein